jgi:hypothetical protein
MQLPIRALLRRGPGVLGFNQPALDGFASVEKCSPQRVFLVDDVYTTGACISGAVVALADAGHEVCGAFVVARRVNPDYQPAAATFWEDQTAQTVNWLQSPVVNRPTT